MVLMGCGHAANAIDKAGKPVCVICIGLDPRAKAIIKTPNLKGRRANCAYCGRSQSSDDDLAFFEYRPSKDFDSYYDGCRGWD